jgi:ubiquinone/menaquinone biosynthesis C-methylase UbiE
MMVTAQSHNERMFDQTSTEYSNEEWFERSPRSRYAYAITRRRLLELLQLDGTQTVLEIGCGAGTWTRILAGYCANLSVVDISQEMLKRAADAIRPYSAHFVHSDMLLFRSEVPFDRVVSVRAIEYVADKAALAEQLARLTASGGELIIISKTPFSVWRGRRWAASLQARAARLLRKTSRADSGPQMDATRHYMQRISPWHLTRLLRAAGFEDVRCLPVIVGLPIIAGVDGDLPIIPAPLANAALTAFDRLGDLLSRLPLGMQRPVMLLSESYAVRARRKADVFERNED